LIVSTYRALPLTKVKPALRFPASDGWQANVLAGKIVGDLSPHQSHPKFWVGDAEYWKTQPLNEQQFAAKYPWYQKFLNAGKAAETVENHLHSREWTGHPQHGINKNDGFQNIPELPWYKEATGKTISYMGCGMYGFTQLFDLLFASVGQSFFSAPDPRGYIDYEKVWASPLFVLNWMNFAYDHVWQCERYVKDFATLDVAKWVQNINTESNSAPIQEKAKAYDAAGKKRLALLAVFADPSFARR
jgi:hypothetical protein